jgi:hypothetical protein
MGDFLPYALSAPQTGPCSAAALDEDLWPTTPMFFPTMLSKVKRSLPDLTNTPVLSANTTLEKSTIFMRDSEIVVDPHSMQAGSVVREGVVDSDPEAIA